MTSEELKQSIPMRSVMEQYNIQVNHANMCCCPFHGERHPSMKVNRDYCHCFVCGKSWDIFSFVMEMENCDFKTAFFRLGGEYNQKQDVFQQIRIRNARNRSEKRLKAEISKKNTEHELHTAINDYRLYLANSEPFTDEWCSAQNDLTILLGWLESKIQGDWEVDLSGVISRYKIFKQKRDNVG